VERACSASPGFQVRHVRQAPSGQPGLSAQGGVDRSIWDDWLNLWATVALRASATPGPCQRSIRQGGAVNDHDLCCLRYCRVTANFEGRGIRQVKAKLAGSRRCRAYALAAIRDGNLGLEEPWALDRGQKTRNGSFLRDLWGRPNAENRRGGWPLWKDSMFGERYADVFYRDEPLGSPFRSLRPRPTAWRTTPLSEGNPPYFSSRRTSPFQAAQARSIRLTLLAVFGDFRSPQDHLSLPQACENPRPARLQGEYLQEGLGGPIPRDFNSYGSRSG